MQTSSHLEYGSPHSDSSMPRTRKPQLANNDTMWRSSGEEWEARLERFAADWVPSWRGWRPCQKEVRKIRCFSAVERWAGLGGSSASIRACQSRPV